jgi:hypothetical protein
VLDRIRHFSVKTIARLRLLRDDPEQFGRNLQQYTDPAGFESRLLDIQDQPPLHVEVKSGHPPALNVLQPILSPEAMTGGPNTIVLLAALVAECGIPVRIVTTRAGHRTDMAWFARHLSSLLNRAAPPGLQVVAGSDAAAPATVDDGDVWLATHWTTAQSLRVVLPRMRAGWFLYLVQDFEPGFHAWSSNHALALETYAMPHRAMINEALLAEYLHTQGPGLYADPKFLDAHCKVFEPAVDRQVFYPPREWPRLGPRKLLLYGRPTNARNMLGLGVQALRAAIEKGGFSGAWEFLSIGGRGSMPIIALGGGHRLRPAPWAGYAAYAESLRQADVLLCPMLSPHTSYPVLEMAACGGIAVTNTFGPKTARALAGLSPEIIGVAPTLQGLTDGLRAAAALSGETRQDRLNLPASWDDVLRPVAQWAAAAVREQLGDGVVPVRPSGGSDRAVRMHSN